MENRNCIEQVEQSQIETDKFEQLTDIKVLPTTQTSAYFLGNLELGIVR